MSNHELKDMPGTIDSLRELIPPALIRGAVRPERLLAKLLGDETLSDLQRQCLATGLEQQLPKLPDPVQALNLVLHFFERYPDKTRRKVLLQPEILAQTMIIFSFSLRLGKLLLSHPEWLAELFPLRHESCQEQRQRLGRELQQATPDDIMHELRRAKAREFIRIAYADSQEVDSFEESTRKISNVADLCVQRALAQLKLSAEPVAVIALGKWGGFELNYSSDIDLLFVAGNDVDPDRLADFQQRAAEAITLLERPDSEGFVFRVDSRLRPEGKSGPLVRSLRSYLAYYGKYGRNWEFQALVKARHGAGDAALAAEFIRATRPFVFPEIRTPAETVLREVREVKAKIEQTVKQRGAERGNVKLGAGGIRDLEFIIQFLQLHHGRRNPALQETGTLTAMQRLYAHRIITREEYDALRRDYIFLRRLEHYLQIAEELPVRQLPKDRQELEVLGRKMITRSDDRAGLEPNPQQDYAARLLEGYGKTIARTRKLFQGFFDTTIEFLEKKERAAQLCPGITPRILEDHFTRLESDYFLRFTAEEIAAHIKMMAALSRDKLSEVNMAMRPGDARRVTIVAFDYLGEFAKISGLFSAYGMNIVSGESFTYSNVEPAAAAGKAARAIYRFPHRRYARRMPRGQTLADRRKIVCVANLQPARPGSADGFSQSSFQEELAELLKLLKENKHQQASEYVALRVMKLLTPGSRPDGPRALPPIEFKLDNESDHVYTILEITSPDQFMFLFEFTNALSTRNYYIGKVEINTVKGMICDRLFITTSEGKKILDDKQLRELTVTITLIKQFATFLPYAPNPQLALRQFSGLVDRVLEDRPDGALPIIGDKEVLTNLARVLGASSFLWEDFLRMQHQNLLPILMDAKKLDRDWTPQALRTRLQQQLARRRSSKGAVTALNAFKDREMFRIDMRHLTRRVTHLADLCRELSDLADVVLSAAFELALADAATRFGAPPPGRACLCALGKWGGHELGYASDIELQFIWDAPASTLLAAREYYEHAAHCLANAIKSKQDGVFELDFRLRPGGKSSPLAVSLKRFCDYYADGSADAYERQALVRLRAVAGDDELCRQVMAHRDRFVYGPEPLDLPRTRELRQRQQAELVKPRTVNAKFSPGGLVDAEYFIQIKQIRHGAAAAELRDTNTFRAAAALHKHALLSDEEYDTVVEGYRFLRALINGLRIVRGNARDLEIPPEDAPEFEFLLRRLEVFEHPPEKQAAAAHIREKMARIHALFESLAE